MVPDTYFQDLSPEPLPVRSSPTSPLGRGEALACSLREGELLAVRGW
jgi:hypothetical protein